MSVNPFTWVFQGENSNYLGCAKPLSFANLCSSQQARQAQFWYRVIFSFSPKESQRLRELQARCLENGLAQTDWLFAVCRGRVAITGTALAKTTSVSPQLACHALVLQKQQGIAGIMGNPVRLTWRQAQGSVSALTPKETLLGLVAQANLAPPGKQGSNITMMELLEHVCVHNMIMQTEIKISATWHSRNQRRKME